MTASSDAAAPERTCLRCERSFTGKAGRLVGGRPVCPSCAPAFLDLVPCPACGRPTRRLGRMPGREGMVCEGCRRKATHATCRVCGRHRRVGRRDEDGRAVCVACAGEAPPVHACPGCGSPTPGTGAAPCRACALRDRVERRVALCTEMIAQPWLRALFQEFCGWESLPRTAGNMTRRIDAYAACFSVIDRHCAAPALLDQGLLLQVLGAEGLRRQHLVVRFLAERLALDWSPRRVEAFVEAGRIEGVLAAADGRPWGPALRAYRGHLALDGALRPRTVRFYLNAAAGLLAQAGHADLALLQQAEVERYLRRKPGQRASLARFLAYAARIAGTQVVLPPKKRWANPKAREKALLREARVLLDRLDQAAGVGEGRALLATAISRIYAVPLSAVLALKRPEVAAEGAAVMLWPDRLAVSLAPALAEALRRWASWDGSYLFPGRNGAQPLSRDAVRYHVLARMAEGSTRPKAPYGRLPQPRL